MLPLSRFYSMFYLHRLISCTVKWSDFHQLTHLHTLCTRSHLPNTVKRQLDLQQSYMKLFTIVATCAVAKPGCLLLRSWVWEDDSHGVDGVVLHWHSLTERRCPR